MAFIGDISEMPEIFGTPFLDAAYWSPQTTDFTCDVVAQGGILHEMTGESLSEAQLTWEATSHGWLDPAWGGTRPEDATQLLELHGVSTHVADHAIIEDVVAELAAGHKVIAGVRQSVLLDPSGFDLAHELPPDHALWVTGVVRYDDDHIFVVVNDSASEHGAGEMIDLDTFEAAWQQSGAYYFATDQSPADVMAAAFHVTPDVARGVDQAPAADRAEAAAVVTTPDPVPDPVPETLIAGATPSPDVAPTASPDSSADVTTLAAASPAPVTTETPTPEATEIAAAAPTPVAAVAAADPAPEPALGTEPAPVVVAAQDVADTTTPVVATGNETTATL